MLCFMQGKVKLIFLYLDLDYALPNIVKSMVVPKCDILEQMPLFSVHT